MCTFQLVSSFSWMSTFTYLSEKEQQQWKMYMGLFLTWLILSVNVECSLNCPLEILSNVFFTMVPFLPFGNILMSNIVA